MNKQVELGGVDGYLAKPVGDGSWPAVIVVQEWWGLDDQTRSVAERFAEVGYLAFAPDLYHGELAQLGNRDKAMSLSKKYGISAPEDLKSVYDALKEYPDCNEKIGCVGFCFGGRMSLILGMHRPVDAICTFYGGGMQTIFEHLRKHLKSPVLGLFGDQDVSIPIGTVEEFDRLLDAIGVEHEVIVYPNSGHAFFRDSDLHVYKPEASKDAWERVTIFFTKHLS